LVGEVDVGVGIVFVVVFVCSIVDVGVDDDPTSSAEMGDNPPFLDSTKQLCPAPRS
jgi:hypothetical protein